METNENVVVYEKVKTSKLAIAALFLGITSFVLGIPMGGFLFGIPGIVISIWAIIHINKTGLEGSTLAKVGLVSSVAGIIVSILTIILITSGIGAFNNHFDKIWDVSVAESMAGRVWILYEGPFEEEMAEIKGTRVYIYEGAMVPECVEDCVAEMWTDDMLHSPKYTGNGACAYIIEFGETKCEAIYITNGTKEWQVYPVVDEEYK